MLKFVSNGLRMTRVFQAVAAFLVLSTAAYADCASLQKGNEIFADSFADNTGGWPTDPDASLGKNWPDLEALYAPNSSLGLSEQYVQRDRWRLLPRGHGADSRRPRTTLPTLVSPSWRRTRILLSSSKSTAPAESSFTARSRAIGRRSGNLTRPSLAPKPGSAVTLRAVVKGSLLSVSAQWRGLAEGPGPGARPRRCNSAPMCRRITMSPKPGVSFEFTKYRVTAGE